MKKSSLGHLIGGMLLVAGCCIGAGMLALPILTGLSGFIPSVLALVAAWAFMTFTGFLLVEIQGWFSGRVNLLSMVEKSLGRPGRQICWASYLFLFYALLVAYTAVSGSILSKGFEKVQLAQLSFAEPSAAFLALPVLVISFGFQNIIPSLASYLHGDLRQVRIAILGGSLLALFIYLVWTLFVLGIVPVPLIKEAYQNGQEATLALQAVLGSSLIGVFAQGFAFFAIVTSFLAQGLSLVHFIADGLKVASKESRENGWLCLAAIVPPAILAVLYPKLFFKALNFAGGICAVILFGFLPIFMSWIGRYRKNITSGYRVKGGKLSLLIALAFALLVIGREISRILGFYAT